MSQTTPIPIPPSLNAVNIPKSNSNPFIFLPILLHTEWTSFPTTVTTLIDSGAQENFINNTYTQKHGLRQFPFASPISLHYADRSSNKDATVQYYTLLNTVIDRKPCKIRTLIMKL